MPLCAPAGRRLAYSRAHGGGPAGDTEPWVGRLRGGSLSVLPIAVRHRGHRAYIGPVPGPSEGDSQRWRAHTEDADGCMVEQVDGSLHDLVLWARERTGWVLVLPANGERDVMRWAGTEPKPADVPQFWDETL